MNSVIFDIKKKPPFTDQCAIEMFRSTLAFFFFSFFLLFFFFLYFKTYFYKRFQVLRFKVGGGGAALATGGTLIFLLFSAPFAASFVLMV